MPENGVDPARFNSVSVPSKGMPMKMCFVGRLVPYKGADMAIDAALMLLRTGRAHLDIVGDGPMMQELVAKVRSEKIEEAVTFHGWVDHQMVQGITSGCSVFLFPSVREFGGAVVLEAMALGLAPVVVDYGGPGELVANGRGLAVPIGSRESIVENVSAALEYFSANPEEVTRLGERARTWAMTNLTWPAKARNMLEIYDWALGKQTSRPLIY
jgi:glycosyltransferase involved in cell wall biosynthesis